MPVSASCTTFYIIRCAKWGWFMRSHLRYISHCACIDFTLSWQTQELGFLTLSPVATSFPVKQQGVNTYKKSRLIEFAHLYTYVWGHPNNDPNFQILRRILRTSQVDKVRLYRLAVTGGHVHVLWALPSVRVPSQAHCQMLHSSSEV